MKQQPLIKVAHRTVVAMTCWNCGKLIAGDQLERRPRIRGGRAYLDRRCNRCRWLHMANSALR